MSVKYICDICGKEVKQKGNLHYYMVDKFERKGSSSVGVVWQGDVCPTCLNKLLFETGKAAAREIDRLREMGKK